jgi:HPt (histidine-containing phosphotransfer) domain-containing protein
VSTLPSDNEKFQKLIVLFCRRLEEQLHAFERAAAEKNFAEVAALAHWLKGSGGTVGFDVFTEPAISLEKFAKEQRADEVNRSIRELRVLAKRLHIPSVSTPEPLKSGTAAGPMATPREAPADQGPVISNLASNDKFKHIVRKFVDRLEEQENRMDRALEQNDLEELAHLALWLKGESGTVGYADFTAPAEQLCTMAKSGLTEQARLKYGQIKRMMQAVVPPTFD